MLGTPHTAPGVERASGAQQAPLRLRSSLLEPREWVRGWAGACGQARATASPRSRLEEVGLWAPWLTGPTRGLRP